MVHATKFNPETHLQKQGWKGKGTALKPGHATRPLAVVRKKTLSGIGKDRDEAVPFWDNIFAATAASIISSTTPSVNPSPSGTPGPSSPAIPDEVTTPSISHLSVAARVGREGARRGLYSKFFRGVTVPPAEDIDTDDVSSGEPSEAEVAAELVPEPTNTAGPSTLSISDSSDEQEVKGKSKSKGKDKEGETKEEKRIRRAEKAQRKAEKDLKRSLKEEKRAKKAAKAELEDQGDRKKKRKRSDEITASAIAPAASLATGSKERKKSKRKKEAAEV